jgi:hypothetical protein
MTDLLAVAIWPIAMGAFAVLFSLFMYWQITRQHPIEPETREKHSRTMAE